MVELLRGAPSFRTRYLVLGPLEQLAKAGDHAAAVRVRDAITNDPDWPIRARAAEAAAGVAEAQPALVSAARDPEPRVREAALLSLATAPSSDAVQAAKVTLPADGWSFVRAQAVAVLAKAPASVDVDHSLGGALHDRSVAVRGAAIVALARHRASSWRDALKERLEDKDEDTDVRAAAASALGAVCDSGSADRLTTLARGLGTPGTSEEEQQVALGALVGLAALQPPDLKQRIGPLLSATSPPSVRVAAQQALTARGACR
jgi:HEAT repeat protein